MNTSLSNPEGFSNHFEIGADVRRLDSDVLIELRAAIESSFPGVVTVSFQDVPDTFEYLRDGIFPVRLSAQGDLQIDVNAMLEMSSPMPGDLSSAMSRPESWSLLNSLVLGLKRARGDHLGETEGLSSFSSAQGPLPHQSSSRTDKVQYSDVHHLRFKSFKLATEFLIKLGFLADELERRFEPYLTYYIGDVLILSYFGSLGWKLTPGAIEILRERGLLE